MAAVSNLGKSAAPTIQCRVTLKLAQLTGRPTSGFGSSEHRFDGFTSGFERLCCAVHRCHSDTQLWQEIRHDSVLEPFSSIGRPYCGMSLADLGSGRHKRGTAAVRPRLLVAGAPCVESGQAQRHRRPPERGRPRNHPPSGRGCQMAVASQASGRGDTHSGPGGAGAGALAI
jgi:hypothetical protein